MLHHLVCWYVKCVEKVPFCKSGHIFRCHRIISELDCSPSATMRGTLASRPEPIVLKILPIILSRISQ